MPRRQQSQEELDYQTDYQIQQYLQMLETVIEPIVERLVDRRLAEHGRGEWLPLAEAAKLLGCSPAALRDRIRRGVVPASTMSRKLYVKRADINNELERKRR